MALKFNAPPVCSLQKASSYYRTQSCVVNFKSNQLNRNDSKVYCSMSMSADQSDNPRKLAINRIMDEARRVWDSFPQPVKSFPWNTALDNFIQIILDLVIAVIKFLSLPVFAITSISEMSYCAHERKLYLVPFPFLVGVAVAGVLKEAALASSPYLKHAEVPWHLIVVVIFFAILKLPGPYYPYWGRILIPHFANGALLRTIWFMFLWYLRPQKASERKLPESIIDDYQVDGISSND